MSGLPAVALVALNTLAGILCIRSTGARFHTIPGFWSASFLQGCTLTSAAALVARALGFGADSTVALALGAAGALAAVDMARRGLRFAWIRPPWGVCILAIVLCALFVLLYFAATARPDNSRDALVIWIERARHFWISRGIPDTPRGLLESKPQYPPLISLQLSTLFSLAGGLDLTETRVWQLSWTAALLGVLLEVGKSSLRAWIGCIAVLATRQIATLSTWGYADIALAAFAMLGFHALFEGRSGVAVVAFAGAALTKSDAVIILSAASIMSLCIRPKRIWLVIPGCAVAAAWLLYAQSRGWTNSEFVFSTWPLRHPAILLDRTAAIASEWLSIAFRPECGFLLAGTSIALLLQRPPVDSLSGWLAVSGACTLAGFLLIYYFSVQPLAWHLPTSLPRTVLHSTFLFLAAILAAGGPHPASEIETRPMSHAAI